MPSDKGSKTNAIDPCRWLEEHGDAMYRYATLRLGRGDDAEDAVQEALLAGIGALRDESKAFAGRSAERTWLIGILKHKVLDAIRKRARDRGPALEEYANQASARAGHGSSSEGDHQDSFLKHRHHDWPDPADPAEAQAFRRAVREALSELPEPMRLAIVLREIDGISGAEACEVLGVTPTNLWTLVHRGKARLRERLSVWWNVRGESTSDRSVVDPKGGSSA